MKVHEKSSGQNQENNIYEFMHLYTAIFTKKIFATKDCTYPSLKDIIRDKDLVLLMETKIPVSLQ